MSKPLHLVPHLNEMMEEYTEGGGGGGGGVGGRGEEKCKKFSQEHCRMKKDKK